MKRYLYIILCGATIACTALFMSCVKDPLKDNDTPGDGKTITANFTLSTEAVEEIEVRSVTNVDERLIKDLWVIQLNEAGTAQLQEPQYIASLTAGSRDYKVAVPLVRSASRVYFIANTHDTEAYKGKTTTADVESVTMAIASEASIANADGIPMSAVWTGTPDLLGIVSQVSLSRAIAKVNFKLDASLPKGESFLLTSVQIKQVPNKLHGYRDAATTGVFPISPTVTDYDPTSYAKVNLTIANPQALWYLPENTRGTGTATVQGDKASKFPTDQKDYCTYIEIKGDYLLGTGQGFTSTYKIYLGANNTTDYNLKRNTTYNVNTTIKGIDAADTRIENVVLAPLDYTDNGSAWFLVAPYDTQNPVDGRGVMNWYVVNGIYDATYNPNTLSACPAGWRMPHKSELMLAWIYNLALTNSNFSGNSYWSQTSYINDRIWITSLVEGTTTSLEKHATASTHCVKDNPSTALKYPYAAMNDSGLINVIVSRDANGGVNSNAIHPNWSQPTSSHTEQDNTVNLVSAKLEVAKEDCTTINSPGVDATSNLYTWINAALACAAYTEGAVPAGSWRLPTQRELKLIYVMNTELTDITNPISSAKYWSATTFSRITESAFTSSLNDGDTHIIAKTTTRAVRCVRDVAGAKRPPIIVGQFGGWDGTKYTAQLQVDWGSPTEDDANGKKWSLAETVTGATDIYYGFNNINTLKKLSSDLSDYPAAKYCADKGNGWYLPSYNQLMAVWVFFDVIPSNFGFHPDYYWASSETDIRCHYVSFTAGFADLSGAKIDGNGRVRCVRDVTSSGKITPKVVVDAGRMIIDSRDMPAGAVTSTKKANTTNVIDNTTLGANDLTNIGSETNNKKVYSYFEIAKVDNSSSSDWLNAVKTCANIVDDGNGKWRLPTQREFQLIWIMYKNIDTNKNAVSGFELPMDVYWSATEKSDVAGWYLNFTNGKMVSQAKDITRKVRCIRDLTPPAK